MFVEYSIPINVSKYDFGITEISIWAETVNSHGCRPLKETDQEMSSPRLVIFCQIIFCCEMLNLYISPRNKKIFTPLKVFCLVKGKSEKNGPDALDSCALADVTPFIYKRGSRLNEIEWFGTKSSKPYLPPHIK